MQNNHKPLSRREMDRRALLKKGRDLSKREYKSAESSRFMRALLKNTKQKVPNLAQEIGVAPQTVNRWIRGESAPRPGQFAKIVTVMEAASPERPKLENLLNLSLVSNGGDSTATAVPSLGLHFSDSIMALEVEARDVWVIKCGALREAARGFMGEKVLQALKGGTNFHYVFLSASEAEYTFVHQLKPWLESEIFAGSVTGYILKDASQAASLGITSTPGAWIAIEYSDVQTQRLHRGFDVFKALPVREYMDASRRDIKNEDGQPCWIELATPQANILMNRLNELRLATQNGGSPEIEIVKVPPQQTPKLSA